MKRGLLIAVLHCGLLAAIAGKYALDRERLPRQWVKCHPVDPYTPLRGRYLSLGLDWPKGGAVSYFIPDRTPDPSRNRKPGEELWVEVSIPEQGEPRPIRLGVKANGVLRPLDSSP